MLRNFVVFCAVRASGPTPLPAGAIGLNVGGLEVTVEIALGIGVGVLVVGFVVYRQLVPSLDSLADRAVRDEDLGPLLQIIQRRPEGGQPTAYNRAIRRLWDGFHRPLAVELMRELAKNYGTTRITQYWLKQVQEVEPGLAKEKLGREFLETYYLPELAAQCGPVG